MKFKKIKSLDELKTLSSNEEDYYLDCFISLAGGIARSSKQIHYDYDDKLFEIINEIDGSFEELSEEELKNNTNIYDAIEGGAFYQYL